MTFDSTNPSANPRRPRFPLGQIVITPGARDTLTNGDVLSALQRHARGDWGELADEDIAENELSLVQGWRLLSSYRSAAGEKFWVITEADRSSTCVLLPDEY